MIIEGVEKIEDLASEAISQCETIACILGKLDNEVIAPSNMDELKHMFVLFRFINDIDEVIEALKKTSYAIRSKLANKLLPEAMETLDVPSMRIANVGKFEIATRFTASFLDKEKGFEWLRERGDGALIKDYVHPQTLSSYVKNMIEEDCIYPPEFVKTSRLTYCRVKK